MRWLWTAIFILLAATAAADPQYGPKAFGPTFTLGGSGSGGSVSLYEARSGNEAALQTALTSTYGVLGLSLVEVTDAQDAFTTTADEICYTGTGGDLLLQASFSFSRQSGAGSVHDLSFAVDKTGAIGAADVVGDEQSRTVGSTDVGMGSLQATATFATDDCVSVLAKVNTTSTIQIEGFSISITAPSVVGVGGGTKRAGGAVVRVNSADIWDFGNSNVLDPATGTITLGTPGAAVITEPAAATGQQWRICEGTDNGANCHIVQAPAALDANTTCNIASDGSSSGDCLWSSGGGSSDYLMVSGHDGGSQYQSFLASLGYTSLEFDGTAEISGTSIVLGALFCDDPAADNFLIRCTIEGDDPFCDPDAAEDDCRQQMIPDFVEAGTYEFDYNVSVQWPKETEIEDHLCALGYLYPSDDVTVPSPLADGVWGSMKTVYGVANPAMRRARTLNPHSRGIITVTTPPVALWHWFEVCGSNTTLCVDPSSPSLGQACSTIPADSGNCGAGTDECRRMTKPDFEVWRAGTTLTVRKLD